MKYIFFFSLALSVNAYADMLKCSLSYRDTPPGTWFFSQEREEVIESYTGKLRVITLEDEISKAEIRFRPYKNSKYPNEDVKQMNLDIFYKNKITLEPFAMKSKVALGDHSYIIPVNRQFFKEKGKFLDRAAISCQFLTE